MLVKAFSGKMVPFSFDELESGSYILRISKPEHVSRDYEISTEAPVELDLKLCLLGDITGDGRVNIGDVARIYAYARKSGGTMDDYQLRCADLTGDDRVNIGDAARAYAKVKK